VLQSGTVIHGLPESRINGLTLRDVTLTAEKDVDLTDADPPVFERVTRTIKPGVGPKKVAGER